MLSRRDGRQKLFVRVNALDTGMTLLDLAAVVGLADGIVLHQSATAQRICGDWSIISKRWKSARRDRSPRQCCPS
jgi:citrate lyase beta subunit